MLDWTAWLAEAFCGKQRASSLQGHTPRKTSSHSQNSVASGRSHRFVPTRAVDCRYNGVEKFVRQNPEANAEASDSSRGQAKCCMLHTWAGAWQQPPGGALPLPRCRGICKRQAPQSGAFRVHTSGVQVLDIEDLARIGESRAVCPYFLARQGRALRSAGSGWRLRAV